jgi:raffinose/stachyose/melibiose transport system permease protein
MGGIAMSIYEKQTTLDMEITKPQLGVLKRRRGIGDLSFNYFMVILLTFFALAPVSIVFFNSVKSRPQLGANPIAPIFSDLHWENYSVAFTKGGFATTARNSLILVASTVSGLLFLGGMAAYSLRRVDMPGTAFMMIFMLILSTVPIWLFVVPLLGLWKQLHLANNLFGLVIIYIALNSPFSIFLLRSYMLQVPSEFEDAARVDGANDWDIFSKVYIPIVWPGLLTTGLVVALHVWNEFQIAFIFVTDVQLMPVTLSFFRFSKEYGGLDYGLTSAGAVMMIAPLILLFLFLQRRFIEGLTQGGFK